MRTAGPDATEIAVPVPQVYKDYLWPRNLWCDWRVVGLHAFAIAAFYWRWRWGGHNRIAYSEMFVYLAATALFIVLAFLDWRDRRKRPWQYVISERQCELIEWQQGGRRWQWHTLVWDREVISKLEECEWRGLPTLHITTAAKKPTERRVYVMVYSHEDRERVSSHVLPLIQHYRRRFRHDFWCAECGC